MFILFAAWSRGEPVKVEEAELFKAYEKDVIAADKKYTGHTVELANVSGNVAKDRHGRYYLVAAGSARGVKHAPQTTSSVDFYRAIQEDALNRIPGIYLFLDSKEADKFSGLHDKRVTVRGKCKGMTKDERTYPGYFVTVEGVKLVK
jgi:hypothetical protein